MSKVDPRILEAATRLKDLMPPEIRENISLGRHSAELANRAKAIRKTDPERAGLIQATGLLLQSAQRLLSGYEHPSCAC
ncbi:hypothetical protein [Tateyamaria omphalii]|nr:hypothetical protein [Tateyamaria omphalii]